MDSNATEKRSFERLPSDNVESKRRGTVGDQLSKMSQKQKQRCMSAGLEPFAYAWSQKEVRRMYHFDANNKLSMKNR